MTSVLRSLITIKQMDTKVSFNLWNKCRLSYNRKKAPLAVTNLSLVFTIGILKCSQKLYCKQEKLASESASGKQQIIYLESCPGAKCSCPPNLAPKPLWCGFEWLRGICCRVAGHIGIMVLWCRWVWIGVWIPLSPFSSGVKFGKWVS